MLTKIKDFVKTYQSDIILVIGVILISLLSFAMGYIVAKQQEKEPIRFENPKHEIRNPKQYQMTPIGEPSVPYGVGKIQIPKHVLNLDI